MIDRSLIHVDGMPKGGKSTLIERLLDAYDGFAFVARCVLDDNLREPKETRPARDAELRRFRAAGADASVRYRFPSSHANDESFFLTDLMADYSDVVLLEGSRPMPYVDLSVYVAESCGANEALLVRKVRDRAREAAEKVDAMERLLNEPGGAARLLEQIVGRELGPHISLSSKNLDHFRDELLAEVVKERRAPPPEPTEHWAVAGGYEGIERAQMVVVNVRREDQRESAGRMLSDLKRLRKDAEVFDDVLGPRGKRTPITAVAANLSDPRDPGTRKAIARIKRSMKGA